jgi:hypothetical protein
MAKNIKTRLNKVEKKNNNSKTKKISLKEKKVNSNQTQVKPLNENKIKRDYLKEHMDCLVQGVKESFNIKNFLKMLAINFFEILINTLLVIKFFIITIFAIGFYFGITGTQIQETPTGQELIELILTNLIIILPIAIIGLAIFLIFSTYFLAIRYRLAKSIIDNEKIGFIELIFQAKEGFFKLLKTNLLTSILLSIVELVILIPTILIGIISILNFKVDDSTSILFITITLIVGLLNFGLMLVISFLIQPLFLIASPIAYFEKKGAIDSIKESVKIGKSQYFPKLIFLALIGLGTIIISLAQGIIRFPIEIIYSISNDILIMMNPFLAIFASIIFIIIVSIISLIFSSYVSLVYTILIIKLARIKG